MHLWLLVACGTQDVAAPAQPSALDGSWLATVVDTPSEFEALVEGGVDPWARLHENDLMAASEHTGPAADRAERDLAVLHEDLGRLSSTAWAAASDAWVERSSLPQDSALTWLAALAALEQQDTERAGVWLKRASTKGSPGARRAATALIASPTLDAALEVADNPLVDRFLLHQRLRAEGAIKVPLGALVLEQTPDYTRELYDPQVHWTLAVGYASRAVNPPEGLPTLLFGHCLTQADAVDDRGADGVRCAISAAAALEVDADPGATDDPNRAREVARSITESLDRWQNSRLQSSSPDGQALLRDLQLIDKLRAQILMGLARDALLNNHPHQAVAYIETGLDKSNPREITPVNAPSMFVVLAEARLLTGHTREALDALQVLTKAYPEAAGVDEIVSDLAILQGLDRQGDSKEN